MSETIKQSGGSFLAQTLKGYGVDHIFFVDAILRHMLAHAEPLGIRRILAHTEKGAAYMADGYARAARKPAVCMSQSVGAANLAAGLQDAHFANSPVIALTGRHIATNQYRHAYQELAHEPLFSQVTKFSGRIETPAQLANLTRHAFRIATSGTTGPVHLDVAGNVGSVTDYWETDEPVIVEAAHKAVPAHRPRPDAQQLSQLAQALQDARRPVAVIGAGVCWSGAQAALVALAQKIELPVIANLDAKAAMTAEPRLDMGITGTYGTDANNHLLAEADFALFIGCDVGDQITCNWKLPASGTRTAHIGVDAEDLGHNLPGALSILADPKVALEELWPKLSTQTRPDWLARAAKLNDEWLAQHRQHIESDASPIRPERLVTELGQWLPKDAVLVADTGYASQWSGQFMQLTSADQTYLRACGSLGWAFPASLGAKCAQPDRLVVCLTGDGGFMYHLPELETAKRWNLRTITVVNNNGVLAQGLKNLRIAQIEGGQRMGDCFEFVQQDFAQIAKVFGCVGLHVDRPGDLRAAFDEALKCDGPVVIDVRSDPSALAPIPWMPG